MRKVLLIRKKIKFSSYISKCRMAQLQRHTYMIMRKGFLIYCMRKCANMLLYMRRPLQLDHI
jgi:hypothetical protein